MSDLAPEPIQWFNSNYFASIYRGGESRLAMIEQFDISLDSTGKGGEIITIAGRDMKGMLAERIALANTLVGDGYDTVSDMRPSQSVIHYVTNNCIIDESLDENGDYDDRRPIPGLFCEADSGSGDGKTWSARFQNIAELLEEILITNMSPKVGYEIIFYPENCIDLPDQVLGVKTWSGRNFAGQVVFNTDYGNINKFKWSVDKTNYKNCVFIAGQGLAEARTLIRRDGGERLPQYLDLYETFQDARDLDTTNKLNNRADATLVESAYAYSGSFEILPDNSFIYMTRDAKGDFDLGDTIRAIYAGIVDLTGYISEITEEYGESTMLTSTKIQLGNVKPNLVKFMKLKEKHNSVGRRI
jgi:hypothetical protein